MTHNSRSRIGAGFLGLFLIFSAAGCGSKEIENPNLPPIGTPPPPPGAMQKQKGPTGLPDAQHKGEPPK